MHKEDKLFDLFGIVTVVLDFFLRSGAMLRNVMAVMVVMALVLGLAGAAYAGALANDEDLDSAAEDIDLTNGQAVVRTSGVFDFAVPVAGAPVVGLTMADKDLIMDTAWWTNASLPFHLSLDLNGGDLTSTTGYIRTETIRGSSDIVITDVRDVLMNRGNMSTRDLSISFASKPRGSVTIGANVAGQRAGDVQVAGIATDDMTGPKGGNVSIYATGNVLIKDTQNTPGTGDDVAKDINTSKTQVNNTVAGLAGTITVFHNGTFLANDIVAQDVRVNDLTVIHHQFDGAVVGSASGSFTVNDILTTSLDYGLGASHTRSGLAGDVTIQNYTSVSVNNIDANFTDWLETTSCAGDVTMTGITGDITVNGTISLDAIHDANTSYNGVLSLSCGGTIRLMQGLDLSLVDHAILDSGPATTNIYGVILGSDGLAASPSNIGSLWAPSGDVLYYEPGLNPLLLEASYTLADENGVAGQGGSLEPFVAPIAEPAGLGLLGLALLGLRKRRS